MICLVLGTPDSGKSVKAENLVMELSPNGKKYYIATMIPYGEEGAKRVKKHRDMRAGKGFETIECPVRVHELIGKVDDLKGSTCLLECMSNLIGNEMHDPKTLSQIAVSGNKDDTKGLSDNDCSYDAEKMCQYIIDSVMKLAEQAKNLVIVSNSFPLEGEGYDEDTRRYTALVDMVNTQLKKRVDKVYELV